MGVFQSGYTPYTNFHELNADWIVAKVKELDERVNGDIRAEIEKVLADAFVDITYNAGEKSISFHLALKED